MATNVDKFNDYLTLAKENGNTPQQVLARQQQVFERDIAPKLPKEKVEQARQHWQSLTTPLIEQAGFIKFEQPDPKVLNSKQYGDNLNKFYQSGIGLDAAKQQAYEQTKRDLIPEKGLLGYGRDIGLSALKGAISVPEAVLGLADIPTGGRVGKFLENKDGLIGFRPEEAKAVLDGLHTDKYKLQQQDFANAQGLRAKLGVVADNPSLVVNPVVESLPLMGAGGLAGRGIMAVAPRVTGLAAGATGEGLASAGIQAEQIRNQTDDGLLTGKQAALAGTTGLATGLFGFGGGQIARRMGIADVDTMLASGLGNTAGMANKGIARRVAEGAVSEGLLEELPQSVSEQIQQNAALDKPLDQGVLDNAIIGTLSGAAMGGGFAGYAGVERNSQVKQIKQAQTDLPTALTQAQTDLQAAQQANDPDGLNAAQQQYDSLLEAVNATNAKATEYGVNSHTPEFKSLIDTLGLSNPADPQPGDIGRISDGLPFANKNAASQYQKKNGLADTHEIVRLGASPQFVLRDKNPVQPTPEPEQAPQELLGLPAPVYEVTPDGTVITTADRNAEVQAQRQAEADRLDRINRGEMRDVTPIPVSDTPIQPPTPGLAGVAERSLRRDAEVSARKEADFKELYTRARLNGDNETAKQAIQDAFTSGIELPVLQQWRRDVEPEILAQQEQAYQNYLGQQPKLPEQQPVAEPEQLTPPATAVDQPPTPNTTADDIRNGMNAISQGMQEGARDQVADYIRNGQTERVTYRKPDAIGGARQNPDYNVQDNADGSVTVVGVRDSEGVWHGVAPGNSNTDVGTVEPAQPDDSSQGIPREEPSEPTGLTVAEPVLSVAAVTESVPTAELHTQQAGDIGRLSDGQTFASKSAAVNHQKKHALADSHDVVQLGQAKQFVLRPKPTATLADDTNDTSGIYAAVSESLESQADTPHTKGVTEVSTAAADSPVQGEQQISGQDEDKTPKTDGDSAAPTHPITDFGEKIGGAKKDLWKGYSKTLSEGLPTDVKDITLSKHFPEPDYQQLLDNGVSEKVLAAVKAMRDEIPAKPRVSHKAKAWGETVKTLRSFAHDLISERFTLEQLQSRFQASNTLKGFSRLIDVYAAVGYPGFTQLKGIQIEHARFTVFMGVKYPKGINKWVFSPPNKQSSYFDSFDELLDGVRAYAQTMLDTPTEARATALDIYQMRKSGDIVIGKKVAAGKYIDLKTGFKTSREAREYLAAYNDELLKLLEEKKEVQSERRETNDPRIGEDYRQGENVTPEKFANTFGFRGVEFGNYVENSKRQQDLNSAYDALLDMATLLNIPPQAISLNGELGLAFGARGSGGKSPAKAHYESGKVVINMTKNNGAGSLAHEWWHALDNYFSRNRGNPTGFISNKPRAGRVAKEGRMVEDDSIRPEVLTAWKGILDAIRNSGMVKRSEKLDTRRSKDYWSTDIEMSARAFERFIIDKARLDNLSNDYLANIVPEEMYKDADAYPYPVRQEAQAIGDAYRNLFNTLKTRQTDKGTALYSRTDDNPPNVLTPADARQTLVEKFTEDTITKLEQSGKLEIVPSLPKGIPAGVEGYYLNGKVVLIADNLSPATVVPVLLHELGGHAGLQGVMPAKTYDSLMQQFDAMVEAGNPLAVEARRRAEAERSEYLPYLITVASQEQGKRGGALQAVQRFIQRIVSAIKAWAIDKLGVNLTVTPDDVVALAERMVKQVAKVNAKQSVTDKPQFSRQAPPANGQQQTSQFDALSQQAMYQWQLQSGKLGKVPKHIGKFLGTMLHKALTNPEFKKPFDLIQAKINHVSVEAYDSLRQAPEVLGHMEDWKDFKREASNLRPKNFKARKADFAKVSDAVFNGTLNDKKVYSDAELRSMGLNDNQIGIYHDIRNAIDTSLDHYARSVMSKIVQAAGVPMNEIMALHNRDLPVFAHQLELEKLADRYAGTDNQDTMANAKERIVEVMEKLGKLKEEGYAPLMRFGDHYLKITDPNLQTSDNPDGTVLRQHYESETERDLAAKRLQQHLPAGHQLVTGSLNPDDYKMFAGVSPETVALFLKESGLPTDDITQQYLKLATAQQSALRRLIHRKGIEGFSDDIQRVLAAFVMSNARYSANRLFNDQIDQSVMDIKDGELRKQAQQMRDYALDPKEEMRGVKNFMFLYYMGGSVMFGLINMTQPIMQTFPHLTRYAGGAAFGHIMRGLKQAMQSLKTNTPPAAYQTDYEKAQREGHLDPQNVWMLQGLERGKVGLANSGWQVFSHAMGYIASVTETINRRATLFAALDNAKKMGAAKLANLGFASEYDFAIQAIQETQGIYNKGNRPRMARGNVGSLLMMYKQFGIAYIEQMIRAAKDPMWGGDRDDKRKALLLMLALLFTTAGLTGLPFMKDLMDLIETGTGMAGKPMNLERETQLFLRDRIGDEFGQNVADGLMYGPFNFNPVVDIQGRTNMGNQLPGTGAFKMTNDSFETSRQLTEIGGATGGLLQNMYNSMMFLQRGKSEEAVAAMAPKAIGDAYKGAKGMATGQLMNERGDKITDLSLAESIVKLFGGQPARVADEGRTRGYEQKDKQIKNAMTAYFRQRLQDAYTDGGTDDVKAVREAIKQWNADNERYPVSIKNSDIMKRVKNSNSTWQERTKVPKGMGWMEDVRPE